MADEKKMASSGQKRLTLIIILAVIIIVGIGVAIKIAVPAPVAESDGLQYATDGVVAIGNDGIYDELMDDEAIALEFKNDAYSADGKVFKCYVGNSPINKFDMFLAIYADPEMTDLICQTGLVSPGSAFETLELDRALEPGDHTVYIAYTQMEDPKTIHAQTLHTMDFHVKE